MNKLIITTTFSIVTAIATHTMAADIEDYAGLPLYDEDMSLSPREVVVHEGQEGYDGLPVTRRIGHEIQSIGFEGHDGYDGLPVIRRIEPTFESAEYNYQEGYDGLDLD